MKKLIICNNVYQTLVALWIVYTSEHADGWDAIVSDHMNNSEDVLSVCANVVYLRMYIMSNLLH